MEPIGATSVPWSYYSRRSRSVSGSVYLPPVCRWLVDPPYSSFWIPKPPGPWSSNFPGCTRPFSVHPQTFVKKPFAKESNLILSELHASLPFTDWVRSDKDLIAVQEMLLQSLRFSYRRRDTPPMRHPRVRFQCSNEVRKCQFWRLGLDISK